ncbi:MAG TPA: DNA endonuclease SmrA [Alcanivoracaceae bacterium]|nr:DNA endonuclease SmrA [Alcanivoracaceae bacterium]
MDNDDFEIFRNAMGDVKPLSADDRVRLKARSSPSLAQLERRKSATGQRHKDTNPLTIPDELPDVGPHDIMGWKNSGIQEGVYRKLRLGRYALQARLDLHRKTLKEGRQELNSFLEEAHKASLRTVQVTHGKGFHSPTPARLKKYVLYWLEEHPLVMAYHSCQPKHGGAGSVYVLIKKSTEERIANRERYTERRLN